MQQCTIFYQLQDTNKCRSFNAFWKAANHFRHAELDSHLLNSDQNYAITISLKQRVLLKSLGFVESTAMRVMVEIKLQDPEPEKLINSPSQQVGAYKNGSILGITQYAV